MKVNIGKSLHIQWGASTRPNSQKAMAENVAGFVDITKIGEDYEQKCSSIPLTWLSGEVD